MRHDVPSRPCGSVRPPPPSHCPSPGTPERRPLTSRAVDVTTLGSPCPGRRSPPPEEDHPRPRPAGMPSIPPPWSLATDQPGGEARSDASEVTKVSVSEPSSARSRRTCRRRAGRHLDLVGPHATRRAIFTPPAGCRAPAVGGPGQERGHAQRSPPLQRHRSAADSTAATSAGLLGQTGIGITSILKARPELVTARARAVEADGSYRVVLDRPFPLAPRRFLRSARSGNHPFGGGGAERITCHGCRHLPRPPARAAALLSQRRQRGRRSAQKCLTRRSSSETTS